MKPVSYFTFAATLLLSSLPASAQSHKPQLRNTFVVATESAIDALAAVDLAASPANYNAAMKSAQTARTNLQQMATEEGEQDVATSVNDFYFAISACHIQAIDNSDTAVCRGQVEHARDRAMTALGKHKASGSWVDGPPA